MSLSMKNKYAVFKDFSLLRSLNLRSIFQLVKFNTRDQFIALVVLLVCAFIKIWDPSPIQNLRLSSFDQIQKIFPREIPSIPNLPALIVDIDEKSLTKYGQWPWSRTVVADLVKNSRELGAALIAFDIVFAESDRLNPENITGSISGLSDDMISELNALQSNDERLASELAKFAVVLGRALRFKRDGDGVQGDDFRGTTVVEKKINGRLGPRNFVPRFSHLVPNISALEDGVDHPYGGYGVFNAIPDGDGVIRRVPSFFAYDRCGVPEVLERKGKVNCSQLFPSLAIEILRVNTYRAAKNKQPRKAIIISSDQAGVLGVKIDRNLNIKTDRSGFIWPHFSKTSRDRYVSASDILEKNINPELIRGKILVVGTSAVGLADIKAVPTNAAMPGVEVHVQILETAFSGDYLLRPNYLIAAEVFFVILSGLILIYLFPVFGAKWTSLVFLGMVTSSILLSLYYFLNNLTLIDATTPLASLVLVYMTLSYLGFMREEAKKKETRAAFSKYLSPDMVERVSNNPDQLKLGGDEKELTLLFCDVRGFTPISELFDPPGLTRLINQLLTPLTNVVLSNKGTVDKYMGDCIMAFWNAPLDDEQHSYNACKSALLMLEEMDPLNERLKVQADEEGREHMDLKVGFGLNTGRCVVGNMGSEQRFDYSVLGDSVNLAARLEGQSKEYGVRIVIGEATAKEVQNLALLELDLILVKGKSKATRIFALLGDELLKATDEFVQNSQAHRELLECYRSQKWESAIGKCNNLIEICETSNYEINGYYELIKARCIKYKESPPVIDGAEWDGAYIAMSK
jgi:adenylate cyclase